MLPGDDVNVDPVARRRVEVAGEDLVRRWRADLPPTTAMLTAALAQQIQEHHEGDQQDNAYRRHTRALGAALARHQPSPRSPAADASSSLGSATPPPLTTIVSSPPLGTSSTMS